MESMRQAPDENAGVSPRPSTPARFPRAAASTTDPGNSLSISRAISTIGDPSTEAELSEGLGRALSSLWPNIFHGDLFIPDASGGLRGLRGPGSAGELLSVFSASWGKSATPGLMPVRPTLVPSDASVGRGPTMSVPVFSGTSLEGFAIVQRRNGAPEFSGRDVDTLTALSEGLGRLFQLVRARTDAAQAVRRSEDDLSAARDVQRNFLPPLVEPNSANVRVVGTYLPAYAVGGDFYDFVDLGNGRLLATIGDVSGKGVAAALLMARLSAELRRLASETAQPAELLRRLNRSLPGQMHDDRFATVVCALVDVPNKSWVIANAGHVLPILRRASGHVSLIGQSSGPPIGISNFASYDEAIYPIEPNDILVLATDGAFEVMSGPRQRGATIGQSRLTHIIETGPHDVHELSRRVVSAAEAASSERDDVALLGLQVGV